jgi:hypothetical protein
MSYGKVEFPRTRRISGLLLLIGLTTESISLNWVHPIAFILFFVVGGTLLLAGVLLFLFSFISAPHSTDSRDSEAN